MIAGTIATAASTPSSTQKPILRHFVPDGLFTSEANHNRCNGHCHSEAGTNHHQTAQELSIQPQLRNRPWGGLLRPLRHQ